MKQDSRTEVITVKTDKTTKAQAKKFAKGAGLTLNSLINICLKQTLAKQHLEIYPIELMSPKLERRLARSEDNIRQAKVSPKRDNIQDFISDLSS